MRDPESSDEFNAAVDALHDGDEAAARSALRALSDRRIVQVGGRPDPIDHRLFDRARMVVALAKQPALDEKTLAEQLGLPLDAFLERWMTRCRAGGAGAPLAPVARCRPPRAGNPAPTSCTHSSTKA